jgi:hypothetical protein
MKKVLLLMVCALMGFALSAQVSENFSDYNIGGKIAQQAQAAGRNYWTTWSNAPGGSEDGVIGEIEGSKCGKFVEPNDQILLLGTKTTGVWELSFKLLVPTGACAYFNIQSKAPVNYNPNEWACQFYFGQNSTAQQDPFVLTPGVGVMDAGGFSSADFTFQHDVWTDVKLIMDLNTNSAEFVVNGNSIHSWVYTDGCFGTEPPETGCTKQIDAMNIFPTAPASQFYIDDIVFAESTDVYSTNFDELSAGAYVAQSYPTWWTTWSNAPGTSEDALITTEQSQTPSNSAKLDDGTDLMFKAGDITAGIYTIDFDMYIPNTAPAYFNLLHFFDPGNDGQDSEWAIGIYMNIPTNSIGMPVGTNFTVNNVNTPFTVPNNAWFHFSFYIDLDNDAATVSVDGEEKLAWTFSNIESGGTGECQLGRVDFWPPLANSVFYIDNFVYAKQGVELPQATLSVMPDELKIQLPADETNSKNFAIISEQPDTRKATWSTYIDYAPLETGTGDPFSLAVCDVSSVGSNYNIGSAAEVDREIGMKLSPVEYKDKLGGVLKQIAYYITSIPNVGDAPTSNLTFRVYGQGSAENKTGELLAEKVLPMANFTLNAWNWVDITPVQLTGGEYWVTVAMHQLASQYPMTPDSGPAKYGGDWIKTGTGGWSRLGADLDCNWAIQVKGDGKVQKVWGFLDQSYGATFAASQSDVKVTVDSHGFPDDIYTANIVILTNVDATPRFDIPLTMEVGDFLSNNTEVEKVTVDDIEAPASTGSYNFRVEIDTNAETANIVVTPKHPNATVTGQIDEQPIHNGQNVFTFTVTAEDGVTTEDYKLLVFVRPVGISELDNAVKLYPNPVVDYLYLKSDIAIEKVIVYDLTGRVIRQINQPANSIDLSDLSSGFYLLQVNTTEGASTQRFIKE